MLLHQVHTFCHYFSKASGVEAITYFSKKIVNSTGTIVVSPKKSFTLNFNINKGLLLITGNYELRNRYGHLTLSEIFIYKGLQGFCHV